MQGNDFGRLADAAVAVGLDKMAKAMSLLSKATSVKPARAAVPASAISKAPLHSQSPLPPSSQKSPPFYSGTSSGMPLQNLLNPTATKVGVLCFNLYFLKFNRDAQALCTRHAGDVPASPTAALLQAETIYYVPRRPSAAASITTGHSASSGATISIPPTDAAAAALFPKRPGPPRPEGQLARHGRCGGWLSRRIHLAHRGRHPPRGL